MALHYEFVIGSLSFGNSWRVVGVVPPGPPTILWGGRGVVGVVGPLGEGERAELTCRSTGGRPPPTLTWTRRGQRLQSILYNVTKDTTTGKQQHSG
ncbi:hypothetical protein Pcinc_035241 [Petrolisthes cinctipes]|uniref:Ig-like domain-containing protein n=1 Tax=Petrolisthes cinctipes TaxID=88211 RepID=A0AAE1BWX2_PETCI|nr:hypothetical protein Pcinc_035241 [Petrolisthes cinctipes]